MSDVGTEAGQQTAAAFADFVAPHWDSMRALAARWCGRGDSEDVVQEALAAAWRLRDRYEPSRGSARVWLLSLTADQARRHRRRQRAQPVTTSEVIDSAVADSPADVDLDRALARLSSRQRHAVILFYYIDLPIADVAAVLKCRPGTVKSTLSDARERLRRLLESEHR